MSGCVWLQALSGIDKSDSISKKEMFNSSLTENNALLAQQKSMQAYYFCGGKVNGRKWRIDWRDGWRTGSQWCVPLGHTPPPHQADLTPGEWLFDTTVLSAYQLPRKPRATDASWEVWPQETNSVAAPYGLWHHGTRTSAGRREKEKELEWERRSERDSR